MDISRLCVNCFNDKGGGETCPYCGYKEGTPAENELHLSPGTVLKGQYLVGRVLGYGGFGVTYIAYDLNLQSVRAIKEYLPGELSSRSTDGATVYSYSGEAAENYAYGLEKFIEEGRLLAKFSSIEAIVSVFDYFRENNTAYLVMEYLDGMDLADYLRQKSGRISWTEASNIFTPIMHALAKVHVTGLIHRDIAPDNIYITNDGKIKLLDFGAARQAIGEKSQSLSVILKPGYAPPEQYHSRGSQGPWTDVYALGATIYRSLTGITPTESLTRVMNDDLRPLSELGIDIPRNAELALSQSLNLDENARFPDMESFYNSLFRGAQAPKVKQKAALIGGGESFSQKAKTTIFKPLIVKITAAVLSVAVVCTLLLAVVKPLINYNTALKLFELGEYAQSGDKFRTLGSYKDSVMLLARSLYKEGESYYKTGDFEDAAEPFEELAGYYPEVEVLVTDADYMDGVADGVDGDFEEAIEVLEEVGDYENAQELIEAAQEEEIQPFIDEALDHELPVTEVEVIEVVAEHEDYSDDVVAQHISDALGDEAEQSDEFPIVTVEAEVIESEQYEAEKPVVTVIGDAQLTEDINTRIESIVAGYTSDIYEGYWNVVDYYVNRNTDGVFSLVLQCTFEGGAHPGYQYTSLNYYTDTGEEIDFSNMFIDGYNYQQSIYDYTDSWYEDYQEELGPDYPLTTWDDSDIAGLDGNETVVITDDAIILLYAQGSKFAWAIGEVAIEIPYEFFGDALVDKYFSSNSFQVSDENTDDVVSASYIDSVDWLIEAACEIEGVPDLETLKSAHDYEGDIDWAYMTYYVDDTSEAELGMENIPDGIYIDCDEAEAGKLINKLENKFPDAIADLIPGIEAQGVIYAFRSDIGELDLSAFELGKPIFLVYSISDDFAAHTGGPGDVFLSDDDYWEAYISAIGFDEITEYDNDEDYEVRTLRGELNGYMIELESGEWEGYPQEVIILIQKPSGTSDGNVWDAAPFETQEDQAGTIIYEEDFERYSEGELPEGWEIVYSGEGTDKQGVFYENGSQCLAVDGAAGWSAVLKYDYSLPSQRIAVEFDAYGTDAKDGPMIGNGDYFASCSLDPGWHHYLLEIDYVSGTKIIYVDGSFLMEGVVNAQGEGWSRTIEHDTCIAFDSSNSSNACLIYVDNISIYY